MSNSKKNSDVVNYASFYYLNKCVKEHANYEGIMQGMKLFYDVLDKNFKTSEKNIQKSYKAFTDVLINASKVAMQNNIKANDYYKDIIMKIAEANNGYLTNELIKDLNISRQYISDLVKEKKLIKEDKGIYSCVDNIPDNFYTFQQRYPKAIYSHMNALYFYNLTEEYPYKNTVTIPSSHHNDGLNKKSRVFYVNDKIYEIGLTVVKTPSGNIVKAYDKERCICDIIKDQRRLDFEQVKKAVINYLKLKDSDINKLTSYAVLMGIEKKVVEFVRMYV